jgi:3-methylfumaryl-CoA hydratase
MELYREHDGKTLASFAFRAISPTFDIAPFKVEGRPTQTGAALWATGSDGSLRMEATAEWRA